MLRERLTDKQLAVWIFMREFFKENDMLPPLYAIRDHFGWKGTATAQYHVKVLEEKGYIERNSVGKYRFTREQEATV